MTVAVVNRLRSSDKPLALKLWNALFEFTQGDAAGQKLKTDEDAGIIYGVKILGRYSGNSHGLREAVNGSEYTPELMEDAHARKLYEGMTVRTDHPTDRTNPAVNRSVYDTFGTLRNVRMENNELRGDLHYIKSHPMAPRVLEDVKRGLGVYGLSHNASAASERFDRNAGRLVIEKLEKVRSVDLVDKPATNRNLWESEEEQQVKTKRYTMRGLLEAQRIRFSKARFGWGRKLLEDDAYKQPLDQDQDMALKEDGTEPSPDDAMDGAFEQSCCAVVSSIIKGETDVAEGLKKLKGLLTTHDKMTGEEEPEDVEESEEADDKPGEKEGANKIKEEQLRTDLDKLKRKDACRDLCESLGFTPKPEQLTALMEIASEPARKTAAEAFKATAGTRTPRSAPPPKLNADGSVNRGGDGNKQLLESVDGGGWDAEAAANRLRRG